MGFCFKAKEFFVTLTFPGWVGVGTFWIRLGDIT